MIELEVYARGLRDLNKILELDLQLEPIAGLHYKIDTNHDLVYFEFDRATLSLREIRAIFLKLGLEPLFIGAIPPELRPRTKTEPLSCLRSKKCNKVNGDADRSQLAAGLAIH